MIVINGEQITKDEAMKLVRMLCNDAKKMAGEFHGMNRSEKFRINWPNEYRFADANWKSFIELTGQNVVQCVVTGIKKITINRLLCK